MTASWWACKTCGYESYDSQGVYAHRIHTGHVEHALVDRETGAGPGSTDEGRAAAMAKIRAAITDARRRHQENP